MADIHIRPIDAVLAAFPDARRRSGYWSARCRAHDDTHASLSIREATDGRVSVKCFAGCEKDDALAAVGLTWKDLLPPTINNRDAEWKAHEPTKAAPDQRSRTARAGQPNASTPSGRQRPRRERSPIATIERLAESKRLPAEWLREHGVAARIGVEIVYRDRDARQIGVRVRERAGDAFRWASTEAVSPYGLDRLDDARRARALWVTDTERDVWILRHHGLAAIAVPEPEALERLRAEDLLGIAEVYVACATDADRTRVATLARLATLDAASAVYDVRLPDGAANLADLARAAARAGDFAIALDQAASSAERVDLSTARESFGERASVVQPPAAPARRRPEYATIPRLSDEVGLPEHVLRDEGVRSRYGVDIPYFDASGALVGTKIRARLVAKDGSFWEAGKPLVPYGLDHLGEAREDGMLFIVEGETDLWTLRYHGFAGLGVPGASASRALERAHLADIHEVFAFVEPDTGGEHFLPQLAARLEELGFDGALYAVRMPPETKDLSALHVASPDGFEHRLAGLLAQAQTVRRGRAATAREGSRVEPDAPAEAVAPPAVGLEFDTWLAAQPDSIRAEFPAFSVFRDRFTAAVTRTGRDTDGERSAAFVPSEAEARGAHERFQEEGRDFFERDDVDATHPFIRHYCWLSSESADDRRRRLVALSISDRNVAEARVDVVAAAPEFAESRRGEAPPPRVPARTPAPETTHAPNFDQWDDDHSRRHRRERPSRTDRAAPSRTSDETARRRSLAAATRWVASVARATATRVRGAVARRVARALAAVDPDRREHDDVATHRRRGRREILPARLVGTPKQIPWAERLREEFGRRLDAALRPALDAAGDKRARDRVLRARRALYSWLGRKTDAAWFIDNRTRDAAALIALAAAEDRGLRKRLDAIRSLAVGSMTGRDEATAANAPRKARARDPIRDRLDVYFRDARRRAHPELVASIDAVARAAMRRLRAADPSFRATNDGRSAREILAALRRDDRATREAVDAYRSTAERLEAERRNTAESKDVELPALVGTEALIADAERARRRVLERARRFFATEHDAAPNDERRRIVDQSTDALARLAVETSADTWMTRDALSGGELAEIALGKRRETVRDVGRAENAHQAPAPCEVLSIGVS